MSAALDDVARYWPYGAAVIAGMLAAVTDRRVVGRPLLGAAMVLIAAGGAIGMHLSPFTFHGGDYYIESLIVMLVAMAGLAGYAAMAAWGFVQGRIARRRT